MLEVPLAASSRYSGKQKPRSNLRQNKRGALGGKRLIANTINTICYICTMHNAQLMSIGTGAGRAKQKNRGKWGGGYTNTNREG